VAEVAGLGDFARPAGKGCMAALIERWKGQISSQPRQKTAEEGYQQCAKASWILFSRKIEICRVKQLPSHDVSGCLVINEGSSDGHQQFEFRCGISPKIRLATTEPIR